MNIKDYSQISYSQEQYDFFENIFKKKWLNDKRIELLLSNYSDDEIDEMLNEYQLNCENSVFSGWHWKYRELYNSHNAIIKNKSILQKEFLNYLCTLNDEDCKLALMKYKTLFGNLENVEFLVMKFTINGNFRLADEIEHFFL